MENPTSNLPNPIYQRLTREVKPPTLKQTVILAAILIVISLVLVLLMGEENLIMKGTIFVAGSGLALIAPVAAGIGALITASDARRPGFALQKLTALTSEAVVRGYSQVALFRIRLLAAIVIGLLPVLAKVYEITIRPGECHIFLPKILYARYVPPLSFASTVPPDIAALCAPASDLRFILLPYINAFALSMFVLAALPAVLFGVLVGLTVRQPLLAMLGTVVLTLIVNVSILFAMMGELGNFGLVVGCQHNSCYIFHAWPGPLVWFVVGVGVLAVMTRVMYRVVSGEV
jgi:hypothetical protein